jgi:hypothetical protein
MTTETRQLDTTELEQRVRRMERQTPDNLRAGC